MEASYNRKDLLAIAFFLGFSSAVGQVLLIRELLTIFRGNEFIIGIIFAAWFLGIFSGARFNPIAEKKILEKRVKLSLMLFPLILAVSLYCAHLIPVVIHRTAGAFYSITTELFLSLVFTIPVSFLIGFFFPPIVSLISSQDRARSGGNIYFIESFGAFAGGLIFSFIFIDHFNPLEIISFLFFISILLLIRKKNKKRRYIVLLLPLILFAFSDKAETDLFKYIWNKTGTGRLISYKRTRYQTVFIERQEKQINVYGDGIHFYSLPDSYEARTVFHLIQSLRNRKNDTILLIGSPGSLPYNMTKTDISKLYFLEADTGLWEMLEPFRKSIYGSEYDNKFSVVNQDLRYFLNNSPEKFDMIISLTPPPENIMLNRYFTREFYALCKSRLKPCGIFISTVHGFSNYMSMDVREFITSIYKGFISEFPYHLKTSGETIYLIGSGERDAIPENFELLISRYNEKYKELFHKNIEDEIMNNFTPLEMRMIFENTQIDYFERTINPLLHGIEKNLDLKPRGYWNHIILSAFQEKSILYNILKGLKFFPIAALLIFIIAMADIKRKYGASQLISGYAIFSIGFVSISTIILMIILYQNFYGIVYYRISLINALFMLGLTGGSFLSNRKRFISLSSNFILLSLALILIIVYTSLKYDAMFWLLILIFSFLCGTTFPTLFLSSSGNDYHATASVLDSMDHFGSVIGSLLTVLFLLPLLGITGTIFFNALVMISGAIILFFTRSLSHR